MRAVLRSTADEAAADALAGPAAAAVQALAGAPEGPERAELAAVAGVVLELAEGSRATALKKARGYRAPTTEGQARHAARRHHDAECDRILAACRPPAVPSGS